MRAIYLRQDDRELLVEALSLLALTSDSLDEPEKAQDARDLRDLLRECESIEVWRE